MVIINNKVNHFPNTQTKNENVTLLPDMNKKSQDDKAIKKNLNDYSNKTLNIKNVSAVEKHQGEHNVNDNVTSQKSKKKKGTSTHNDIKNSTNENANNDLLKYAIQQKDGKHKKGKNLFKTLNDVNHENFIKHKNAQGFNNDHNNINEYDEEYDEEEEIEQDDVNHQEFHINNHDYYDDEEEENEFFLHNKRSNKNSYFNYLHKKKKVS